MEVDYGSLHSSSSPFSFYVSSKADFAYTLDSLISIPFVKISLDLINLSLVMVCLFGRSVWRRGLR